MKEGTIVDQRSDEFGLWPFGLGVVFLRQTVPSALVRDSNFCEIVFLDGLVEVYDELCSRCLVCDVTQKASTESKGGIMI